SISFGLILEIPSPPSTPVANVCDPKLLLFELSMGTPSITYKGWELPDKDEFPLMTTREDPDMPEAAVVTCTPAIFADNAVPKLVSLALSKSSPLSSPVAYVSAFLSLWIPKAVTTTSSKEAVSSINTTSITDLPPTSILWLTKPINENTKVLPSGTDKVYSPFKSVAVPIAVPGTDTVTPGMGLPFSSVTLPLTVTSACVVEMCPLLSAFADAICTINNRNTMSNERSGILQEL